MNCRDLRIPLPCLQRWIEGDFLSSMHQCGPESSFEKEEALPPEHASFANTNLNQPIRGITFQNKVEP